MATPGVLTLNIEQHVFLHILLDGNTEGTRDQYILSIMVNRGIQGVLV